jgi:hypothetical protein
MPSETQVHAVAQTVAQLEAFEQFYALVSQVADAFGSEDTSSGKVIPTTAARSLGAAVRRYFPPEFRVYPLEFAQFESEFCAALDNEAVGNFLEAIRPLSPRAAYIAEDGFDPRASNRGAFRLCLFIDATREAGTRFLVYFNRVET